MDLGVYVKAVVTCEERRPISLRPFVLILGMMRTGTTLLQELFTSPGESFILHEPWMHHRLLLNREINGKVLRRDFGVNQLLPDSVMPELGWYVDKLREQIPQVGSKEVRMLLWENYLKIVPDLKVILIGRDPRDIYRSCAGRLERDTAWKPRHPPFNPGNLLRETNPDINAHWKILKVLEENSDRVFPIVYEDLCQDTETVYSAAKEFVESPITGTGGVGCWHSVLPRGKYEGQLHGDQVSSRSVQGWKKLPSESSVSKDVKKFWGLCLPYRELWKRFSKETKYQRREDAVTWWEG